MNDSSISSSETGPIRMSLSSRFENIEMAQHLCGKLLEPYDLRRQFDILRALGPTPVRAPRALWFEPSGDVLGREFYVMERLGGTVYERSVPEDLATEGT